MNELVAAKAALAITLLKAGRDLERARELLGEALEGEDTSNPKGRLQEELQAITREKHLDQSIIIESLEAGAVESHGETPPVVALREPADDAEEPATIVMSDVYRGLEGVPRGTVKYLRVMEQIPKPWAAEVDPLPDIGLIAQGHAILARGVGGIFMNPDEKFAHGLNERVPIKAFYDALDQVVAWDPDSIFANHRANMSTYIGEAEHLVATMQTVLATN